MEKLILAQHIRREPKQTPDTSMRNTNLVKIDEWGAPKESRVAQMRWW